MELWLKFFNLLLSKLSHTRRTKSEEWKELLSGGPQTSAVKVGPNKLTNGTLTTVHIYIYLPAIVHNSCLFFILRAEHQPVEYSLFFANSFVALLDTDFLTAVLKLQNNTSSLQFFT